MNAAALIHKTLLDDLIDKAKGEWESMWHNGSIRDFPYEDDEADIFWDWLGDEAHTTIVDMEMYIHDEFNLDWKIYTWGRGGATFAPDVPGMGRNYSRHALDLENQFDFYYLEKLSDTEEAEQLKEWCSDAKRWLDALKFINETVKSAVACIPEAWADFKEANPDLFETEQNETEDDEPEYKQAVGY